MRIRPTGHEGTVLALEVHVSWEEFNILVGDFGELWVDDMDRVRAVLGEVCAEGVESAIIGRITHFMLAPRVVPAGETIPLADRLVFRRIDDGREQELA